MSPCTPHRWSKSWCSSFAPVHPINAGLGPFGEVNTQLCGAALCEQTEHGANAASVVTSLGGSKMFLFYCHFN